MKKKNCNLLRIVKNKKVLNPEKSFNYVFEWYNDDELLRKEVYKVSVDEYNMPIEDYDTTEMIEHKKDCCMIIEDINIEEVEI